MLIRTVMTTAVITIEANQSCAEGWDFFQSNKLRRAPVVEGGEVVGMITDRDLQKVLPWTIEEQERRLAVGKKTVIRSIMAPNMLSVGPNDHLEKAAQLMLRAKVGGLPVLDGGKLVGIITEPDPLKLLVRRTLTQKGHHLVLRAPEGSPRDLNPAQICVDAGARLYDLALYPIDKDRTSVVLQVHTKRIEKLIDAFIVERYELILMEKD